MTFIKKRIGLAEMTLLKKRLRAENLSTVCEDARCPNIGECFHKGVATFLIAGTVCTRGCRFCAVNKGLPAPVDAAEPGRVARMVKELKLRYVVVTSVTRDDLADGGARHFAAAVEAIRAEAPDTAVETLVPDFKGNESSIDIAAASKPDVFSHNVETVPRLYKSARAGADYRRSLDVLSHAKKSGLTTKSGIMLGLGEQEDEVLAVMKDLREAEVEMLTIGQYLAPSKEHLPVRSYITASEFEKYRATALSMGFTRCSSGSYARSSYLAELPNCTD